MSTIAELLTDLHRLDIKLWLEGERLRYDAPKGALTPALRQTLRARKAEIVSYLHQVQRDQIEQIPTVGRDGVLPLSFSQQRLWFLAQLEGSHSAYNMPAALRLSGPLDVDALNTSWQAICQRHEALRTTFSMVDGQARQQIHASTGKIDLIDLSHLPKDQQESDITRFSHQEAKHVFDLTTGPLWRVTLLRLAREEHVLLVTMHHIICDGWSIGILIRELSALYASCSGSSNSSSPSLPDLPIQYADFAVWQREWLSGNVLQQQVEYWNKQLAGAPPLLTLPTDHARPPQQSYRGAHLSITLPKALTSKLVSLSNENNTTLFMTLQAAFAVLLSRYSAQQDILIGTPIANRQMAELENLIGFFVNTLVLRNDLSGNPSFCELLARVRQVTLDAYQHQALPFELLVETLQPERSLSYSPLFQVMFSLENDENSVSFANINATPIEVEYPVAKFDLLLTMQEREEDLIALWEYSTDLFERATIERMAEHFQTLLTGIVADPLTAIAHLPLLSEAEKDQLLVEWNDTAADYDFDRCLHHLLEAQVARTPDAVAVVFENQQLTYHELNQRANQLAHHLIAQGVGPDVLVGICVERSLEMVVGVLAILKAGGAYVPLDPTYPAERLAFMFSDAQVKLVLTQAKLSERISLLTEASLLELDTDHQWPPSERNLENPITEVKPTNLAYIIYTSGSTGRPKGVMITHRAICNHTLWMQETLALTPSDKVLQKTPFSFDASITEFYAALLVGAQLVIARPLGHQDSSYMIEVLQSKKITTLVLVPSQLRILLSAGGLEHCDALKYLLCGGEALPLELVKRFKSLNGAQVGNFYGPTEACIDATFCEVKDKTEIVPIGRPISNLQAYILDEHLQPVPPLVAGELHIGGVGLARGYLNRPQLTAKKFIPNPFGPGRLYKTGDLCRYILNEEKNLGNACADAGSIEFLGRIDHQVKIRGFRIELGEIEALLNSQPNVREAVVVVVDSGPSKQLVAYVVIEDGVAGAVAGLRAKLSQKLPDYMIPSVFVSLEAISLTPSGKINRRALPDPRAVRQAHRPSSDEGPRTPVESSLATIWQEVLGVKEVGMTENFFEIGGDSILSIQIVSRAKEAGIHLTPRELFQHQTIAELASVARSVQQTDAEQGIVTGMLPLTPIQHWFFEQKQKNHHFNQSVLLELTESVNPTWLEEAVRALLAHHDALRLRFECQPRTQAGGGSWRQEIIAHDASVPFEVIELSSESVSAFALEKAANELQASLNLSEGPLLRVALFTQRARGQNRSKTKNRLLIIIHHLAVDGVSWRILLEDLQRAYQQLANGDAIHLPAKTTSFKEWATLLHKKGANALWGERDYWAQLSADGTSLPVDYAPHLRGDLGPNDHASAAHISTRLDHAQTDALLNEVPAVYQTQINDLLLTALLLAWKEWTGQSALLLELEGHGRESLTKLREDLFEVDLSRTVGWFTTIFPVRLELTTLSLGDTIKNIKEQLRQIPNRGIGYGILRYLSSADVPDINAQVSFNYLGQFDQIVSGPLINALATESSGTPHSPDRLRTHLLDLNSMVVEGQLQVDWTYSRNFHHAETIQELANHFIDTLQALIAHCQAEEAGGYTPSDFPEADLNQEALDDLLSGLKL